MFAFIKPPVICGCALPRLRSLRLRPIGLALRAQPLTVVTTYYTFFPFDFTQTIDYSTSHPFNPLSRKDIVCRIILTGWALPRLRSRPLTPAMARCNG
jgi:hypothetical protein